MRRCAESVVQIYLLTTDSVQMHRAYALQREGAESSWGMAGDGMHVLMRKLKEAAKWHLHRSLQPVWS